MQLILRIIWLAGLIVFMVALLTAAGGFAKSQNQRDFAKVALREGFPIASNCHTESADRNSNKAFKALMVAVWAFIIATLIDTILL